MISANLYVKVDLDQEGKKRVAEAIVLMDEIVDVIQECGSMTGFETEALITAMGILENIHAGRCLG